MERQILHLRVPSFPVAVYRVKDPSLRGRPILVSAGRGPRAVALSVSDEARQEGIRPGMTVPEALRWCRSALVLAPDIVLMDRAERALEELLARYSPRVEPVRGGRFFADLTGTGRLMGPAIDVARRAQKEIEQRLGLGPNAGLASNKLVSGVAAQLLRPAAFLDVLAGQEAVFLSPLAVRHLPAIDPRTEGRMLDELNIRKVKDLAAVDLSHLSLAFGTRALTLHRQARGLDDSPVRPPEKAPVVEADETLAADTNDDVSLLSCLFALVERCGVRLRRLGMPAGEATMTARYTDGVMVTRRTLLSPPSNQDLTLFARIHALYTEAVARRGRIRYLRVRFTRLAPAPLQMSLLDLPGFGPPESEKDGGETPDREPAVIAALDRIRRRFGEKAILFGRLHAA